MHRLTGALRRICAWVVLPALLAAPPGAPALEALSAAGLTAKYTALAGPLRSNAFQRPLYLESSEDLRTTRGDAYAVLDHPFAAVSTALDEPAQWCDVLILHLNTKYCRGDSDASAPRLHVRIGRKYDQPPAEAALLVFRWQLVARQADYLDIELDAPTGPYGTRDYRIVLEAIPLDAQRTFIHLNYSFGYGPLGRVALQAYLSTVARDKVGFTPVPPGAPGHTRGYVGGTRGLVERNTMRYFLAIEAYVATAATAAAAPAMPAEARLDQRLDLWFTATERYARQLHELDRSEYLDMKRKETKRLAAAN